MAEPLSQPYSSTPYSSTQHAGQLQVNIDRGKVGAPVDVFGAATATLALLLIAWGLTQSKDSENAMLWIVAGLIMAVVFLALQARVAHPMVPLKLFANPTFSAANLFSFTFYSALSMMFFFMPMTFIAGWNESEINTSAAFAPMSVFIAGFSARAGQLADKVGPRPLLMAGGLIVATGYASMGYFAPDQDLWLRVLPSMCLVGFGMALVVAPLSAAVMGAVQNHQSGVASGVNNAVSRMASLISVAAVGGLISRWYIAAGGVSSFGVASDAGNQALAMSSAFQRLAYLAAGLAIASAIIATQIRRPALQD